MYYQKWCHKCSGKEAITTYYFHILITRYTDCIGSLFAGLLDASSQQWSFSSCLFGHFGQCLFISGLFCLNLNEDYFTLIQCLLTNPKQLVYKHVYKSHRRILLLMTSSNNNLVGNVILVEVLWSLLLLF